jgi:myosin-light-chain kinase
MNVDVQRPSVREDDNLAPKFVDSRQKHRKIVDKHPMELEAILVEGTEPLAIRWTHDKVDVQDSLAFRYKRNGKSACLLISDPFPEDSGEYVCWAENTFGLAKAYIELTVIG